MQRILTIIFTIFAALITTGCCECPKPQTPSAVANPARVALRPEKVLSVIQPVKKVDAEKALKAWLKRPRLPSPGGHIPASKKKGTPGGHIYGKVPGLPGCAVLFCPFRPGCYRAVVKERELGRLPEGVSDESCVDAFRCSYADVQEPGCIVE